ncbi:MAG TPA: alpha/beta hydrolase [Acidimicrobiales bacterium]|nr:alpha/beta hydrolase [Acidimicrobiales bacterium]
MLEIATGDGLVFTARAAGPEDGRPVLLLHGFPQTSRCWAAQLDALAGAGFRALAFDQRGYSAGARPDDVAAYKPAALVADVLAVADACGMDRFDLVGHDFGGMVAWMVAGHHPDRVRTLTIASTPHPAAFKASYQGSSDQSERSGYMRSFRAAGRGESEAQLLADDAAGLRLAYTGLDPDAVEEYLAALSAPGALVAAVDWYRSMSGAASAATPPSPVPTLYAWSDQDPSLGRDAAEATAALVTGPYRFEVLEGVGHWIPELAADRFTPLLLEHLRSH